VTGKERLAVLFEVPLTCRKEPVDPREKLL